MAGYSSTPLAKKLGIKEGHTVLLVGAPPGFEASLEPLPASVTVRRDMRGESPLHVIVLFSKHTADFRRRFAHVAGRLHPKGGLWAAWPKKASGVATDLTESVVRGHGLASGLVDNKVCAIDEIWSGLRFVRRLADRKPSAKAR